ncbi:hypothetical protein PG993_002235 [Apiospora rasikravindrae]|uniref:Altered inheritance of mitochondria protein 6 n=1 Tax=Apiospora rasikravindrae TaxID=990691 RepID=A0ABR1TW35_9PEZI
MSNYPSDLHRTTFDTPTTNATAWLDATLDSVVPVKCHSHNDYWREYPLFSGLAAGCTGTEADVYLSENGQDLLVGHDLASISPEKTLRSMYLDPLFEMLQHRNSENASSSENDQAKGVYITSSLEPLILLIDVKEKPDIIWPMVIRQLESFRRSQFLTRYEVLPGASKPGRIVPGPLTVVGSGDLHLEQLVSAYDVAGAPGNGGFHVYHDTFLDAPLADLDVQGSGDYQSTNSYYVSSSFKATIGQVRFGFSHCQMEKLRDQVRAAKDRGLVIRYWAVPGWPLNYRDYIWRTLRGEGVEVLNVDEVKEVSARWTSGYLKSVVAMIVISGCAVLFFTMGAFFHYRRVRTAVL